MRFNLALILCTAVVGLSACDDTCEPYYYDNDIAVEERRNPNTGLCEPWGTYPGGNSCDDVYLAGNSNNTAEPIPDWPQCYGQCSGLDEQTCQSTPGCQAGYTGNGVEWAFYECWQTTDYSWDQRDCELLDAYACVTRDDCVKRHDSYQRAEGAKAPALVIPLGNFIECASEEDAPQGCYSDGECGVGYTCTAEEECLPPPGCVPGAPCDDVCYGYCVPDGTDPGTCDGVVTCERVEPNCPTGTVPGVKDGCYTDVCIPLSECGGNHAVGKCYGEVACDVEAPACPDGTLPGLEVGGCWTGYCIPVNMCEVAPACLTMSTEAQCISREDCTALYEGVDCTCNGDVCDCTSWNYASCE
jgi:hypothetical protein